jgi:hypothetical protein
MGKIVIIGDVFKSQFNTFKFSNGLIYTSINEWPSKPYSRTINRFYCFYSENLWNSDWLKISDLAITVANHMYEHSMFTRNKRHNIMDGSHHMWRNRKGFEEKALIDERLPMQANENKGIKWVHEERTS